MAIFALGIIGCCVIKHLKDKAEKVRLQSLRDKGREHRSVDNAGY